MRYEMTLAKERKLRILSESYCWADVRTWAPNLRGVFFFFFLVHFIRGAKCLMRSVVIMAVSVISDDFTMVLK